MLTITNHNKMLFEKPGTSLMISGVPVRISCLEAFDGNDRSWITRAVEHCVSEHPVPGSSGYFATPYSVKKLNNGTVVCEIILSTSGGTTRWVDEEPDYVEIHLGPDRAVCADCR